MSTVGWLYVRASADTNSALLGFQPKGSAIGVLPFAFFGSRANGDLYRANMLTGKGEVFSAGPGTASLGMKVDLGGRLFVAGGGGGDARVVNDVR
jgi:hypothetical protein